MRRQHALVVAHANRIVRNYADAEDIAQKVWLRAHQHIDAFRHEAEVSSWLFAITRNCSIDFLRRKRGPKQAVHAPGWLDPEALFLALLDPAPSPYALARRRDQRAALAAALRQLRPVDRRVLVMRLAGYKYREIADLLGMPLGTVKSRTVRSRRFVVRRCRHA